MTAGALSSPDALALLAALDAPLGARRDDGALIPLADLLEEAGDARAPGLRRLGGRRPAQIHDSWGWQVCGPHDAAVSPAECPLMPRGRVWGDWRLYEYRSDALLALAEALRDA